MANLYIAEYQDLARDGSGDNVPVPPSPPIVEQKIAYTTAAASAAFNNKTKYIGVIADAKAHLEFGSAPTATADNGYIPADVMMFYGVTKGDKVSAYDGSS